MPDPNRSDQVPDNYTWLVTHRRLVVSVVAAAVGFISLIIGWIGVSGTVVVADQLSYLASGGLIGLFLLGISAIAFWAEQRERELARLTEIEQYLGAIALAMGLLDPIDNDGLDEVRGSADHEDAPVPVSH